MFVGFGFLCTINAQQDCSLGIGASNMDTLIQVFQLRAEQKVKLEEYQAAVGVETQLLEDERKELFETHPQSTPDDLMTLASKYKVLEDKMKAVFKKYDLKLLGLFNEKQYQRYLSLCREVSRQPLRVPQE
ncbi:hypothetical protein KCTC52924_02438 [Arenibacter antarcticus]|uniref:LTXXQ motif family protein n=1 Tax=Arenibacter antarcticus TaxID=2040469 RepID=A0ABW5VKD0_9FLAO|nr:hypothetical protein [Arenibacter sp. H213]